MDNQLNQLLRNLKDDDNIIRQNSVRALIKYYGINEKTIEAYISVLDDKELDEVRDDVIIALGKYGDLRAADALYLVWVDEEEFIEDREAAALALIQMGDSRLYDLFEKDLPCPTIPWREPEELSIHDEEAIIILLKIFVEVYQGHISDKGQYDIMDFLSGLNFDIDNPVLKILMNSNENWELRVVATEILSTYKNTVKNKKVINSLIEALEFEDIKISVVRVLIKLRVEEALEPISQILEELDDGWEKREISELVWDFVSELIEIATDKEESIDVRIEKIRLLGTIKDQKIIDKLKRILDDKTDYLVVRRASAEGIKSIVPEYNLDENFEIDEERFSKKRTKERRKREGISVLEFSMTTSYIEDIFLYLEQTINATEIKKLLHWITDIKGGENAKILDRSLFKGSLERFIKTNLKKSFLITTTNLNIELVEKADIYYKIYIDNYPVTAELVEIKTFEKNRTD